jgi:hypothetical protein
VSDRVQPFLRRHPKAVLERRVVTLVVLVALAALIASDSGYECVR